MHPRHMVKLGLAVTACFFALSCESTQTTPEPLSELLIGTAEAASPKACDKQDDQVTAKLLEAMNEGPNAFGQCRSACSHALILQRQCDDDSRLEEVETTCDELGVFKCHKVEDECPVCPPTGSCEDLSTVLDQCKLPPEDLVCNETSLLDSAEFGQMLWNSAVVQDESGVSLNLTYEGNYANQNGPRMCSISVFTADFQRMIFETDQGCPTGMITLDDNDDGNPPDPCPFDVTDDIGGINCPDYIAPGDLGAAVNSCSNTLFGFEAINEFLDPLDVAFAHYFSPPGGPYDLEGLNHFLASLGQLGSHLPSLFCCFLSEFGYAQEMGSQDPPVAFSCEDFVNNCVDKKYDDPEDCANDTPGDPCMVNGQPGTCEPDDQTNTTDCGFFNEACDCQEP